jgi:anti-sigma regulatory factor (Ser/Thr protein kinase)
MNAIFQKTLRKDLGELIALAPEVDAFLAQQQTPAPAVFRVQLALEEIIRNLVEHASAAQRIDVRLDVAPRRLLLEIEDDGAPFDPRSLPEFDKSQPLEKRQPGGMGLQLVRSMVREITYQRLPAGNRLLLIIARE